ncbi:MAG: uracil-DNA glycosylase [Spirosomaceae bacterium]|nr:uracil-DNA glycosylase [Spirosomataceae bacterium]
MADVQIATDWKELLATEFNKPYFNTLIDFVKDEYKNHACYPPGKQIFNAFDKCSFENTRVVILGQDPYHNPGQAHGLCFSVNDGVPMPPSLLNVFKELRDDVQKPMPTSGNLEKWAEQGVLLLNSTLTVRAGKAGSHQKQGWEKFTDEVIRTINNKKDNVVFMLWGKYAQDKGKVINAERHFVLKSKHPSPLSANFGGWFGNKHFSQANNYLKAKGLEPIEW